MYKSTSLHFKVLSCLAACLLRAAAEAGAAILDTNFTATVSGAFVHSIAAAPEGKVLLGGSFSTVNGVSMHCVARLNSDGSLDPAFNPGSGANGEILALVALPDGKAIVGGSFTSVNRVLRNRIARLNPDGSVDTDFNPGTGAEASIRVLRLQPDGKILLGGQFSRYNGTPRSCVARLNSDGSVDTTFSPGRGVGGTLFVNTMAVLSDGKIMVGGDFSLFDGHPCGSIVRLLSDGSLDPTFSSGKGPTPDNPIISLAIQSDGRIVIGGSFNSYQGVRRINIARLEIDGSLDTTFDPGKGISGGLYNMIQSVAICPGGEILVGGAFERVNGLARANLVLLNADGTLQTNFMTKVDAPVRSILLQDQTSSILFAGEFTRVDGTSRGRVARLNGSAPARQARLINCNAGPDGFHCRAESMAPVVALECSVDLVHWLPLCTNATLNARTDFHDAATATLTCRFYRLRQ
jgi:uncharacterized delta-60 repeat protein